MQTRQKRRMEIEARLIVILRKRGPGLSGPGLWRTSVRRRRARARGRIPESLGIRCVAVCHENGSSLPGLSPEFVVDAGFYIADSSTAVIVDFYCAEA
jgi:hypothetical protein